MKKYLFILFIFLIKNLNSASLDGTSNIVYQNFHNVFHDGNSATGFVRLNNGFTILAGATATLDTFITVSGGIDLRDTGILRLASDLFLDSNITLSNGGKIFGKNHAIVLSGDLQIPANKILEITDDTIIEGKGNSIYFDNHAQIVIDTNITLTLKNIFLKNQVNPTASPAISLDSQDSKLTLDNVVMAFNDDFVFNQGQIFIHNDVTFTGTSGFVYQSTQPSFITSGACLLFDNGTTFSYTPASGSKDLIMLQDNTSQIYFNNCSLITTDTGFRLTKGQLYFENQVYIETNSPRLNPQALSNGFVWGNSSLGSDYNLNVNILGSAFIELNGIINDDSI